MHNRDYLKMKKALIITPSFPPQSGPGVHRSRNLVKYLHHFGYEPIVITVSKESLVNDKKNTDESLLEGLPENLKIYRTKSFSTKKIASFLMKLRIFRLFWYFMYPIFWETSALWPIFNYSKAKNIIIKEKIDIIYTSSGPFSSMLLGYFLQKKFKLPWVADLRDPFTDAYAWLFPSYYHWLLARKWEKWMFVKPDKLIVNTNEVKKLFVHRKLVEKEKMIVINNGF